MGAAACALVPTFSPLYNFRGENFFAARGRAALWSEKSVNCVPAAGREVEGNCAGYTVEFRRLFGRENEIRGGFFCNFRAKFIYRSRKPFSTKEEGTRRFVDDLKTTQRLVNILESWTFQKFTNFLETLQDTRNFIAETSQKLVNVVKTLMAFSEILEILKS